MVPQGLSDIETVVALFVVLGGCFLILGVVINYIYEAFEPIIKEISKRKHKS